MEAVRRTGGRIHDRCRTLSKRRPRDTLSVKRILFEEIAITFLHVIKCVGVTID